MICSMCEACVRSSWFGYRRETRELWLVVLATGVRPVSSVRFWLQGKTCELVALGYSWVTEMQYHA
jgi:hypothetical protein